MPQFAIHRNRNAATKARFPFLLDVQADLLDDLGTRVVIPLTPATVASKRGAMQTLTPLCTVEGRPYLLLTPQLAGISTKELGPPIGNLSHNRQAILAALDLLWTGIWTDGANDLFIAAHALEQKATLVTDNVAEFQRVPGQRIENWVRAS